MNVIECLLYCMVGMLLITIILRHNRYFFLYNNNYMGGYDSPAKCHVCCDDCVQFTESGWNYGEVG